jgi:hypothetical protein
MVVFIYRPSPQVPRPSLQAAIRCYDACQYNIYMTKRQIDMKSVDVTWIFVQAIFMCINTVLWTLSYMEVRRLHSREEVEGHLNVAMESIRLASDRWPGVASAMELYRNLIGACMEIFNKDGDVPITAGSPSDCASVVSGSIVDGINRSRTTSPATASTASVSTPSDTVQLPFGYLPKQNQQLFGHEHVRANSSNFASSPSSQHSSLQPTQQIQQNFTESSPKTSIDANVPIFSYPPTTQFTALPTTFAELPQWNPNFSIPQPDVYSTATMPLTSPLYNEHYAANQGYEMADYLNPGWSQEARANGLNQQQQMQLMHDFEMNETSKIEEMIHQSHQLFQPPQLQTF